MSLNGIDNSNNELVCTITDGVAESKVRSYDSNISEVDNIIGEFEFANISKSSTTEGDTLKSANYVTNVDQDTGLDYAYNALNGGMWRVEAGGYATKMYQAFDGSVYSEGRFMDQNFMNISHEFPEPEIINVLTTGTHPNTATKMARDISIYGSSDGINKTLLHTLSGLVWADVLQTFTFENSVAYKFYHIDYSNTSHAYIYIAVVKLFSSTTLDSDKLVCTEPIKDGDKLIIVKDDNSVTPLVASGVVGKNLTVTSQGDSISTVVRPVPWFDINAYGFTTGLMIKPDGTVMYRAGYAANVIHAFTLTTPWQIDTAVYLNEVSVGARVLSGIVW
ncbi:MAG: hypothetical protein GQ474_01650, partial [Sulfurimonas sp.]|nr:hypothetical protein [Sulfurimonas sp.]